MFKVFLWRWNNALVSARVSIPMLILGLMLGEPETGSAVSTRTSCFGSNFVLWPLFHYVWDNYLQVWAWGGDDVCVSLSASVCLSTANLECYTADARCKDLSGFPVIQSVDKYFIDRFIHIYCRPLTPLKHPGVATSIQTTASVRCVHRCRVETLVP